MTIYDIINYAILIEMQEAMGESAFQKLLFILLSVISGKESGDDDNI